MTCEITFVSVYIAELISEVSPCQQHLKEEHASFPEVFVKERNGFGGKDCAPDNKE